jgi:glutathione S-transferase
LSTFPDSRYITVVCQTVTLEVELMHLHIANKLYSSWSLRPWMLMTALGIPFKETVIPMYQPDSQARMKAVSPSGKMPVLTDGETAVWESLAIMEYLAEKFPGKGVWPKDGRARAHARAASSEMHAGFQALRQACPMNLAKSFAPRSDLGPDVAANVARLAELWLEARARFGADGRFLYGAFSAADAMFAPVVTRLDTYQIQVDPRVRGYMDQILFHPAFTAWREQARVEPALVPHYEEGWSPVKVFHTPGLAVAKN